MPTKYYIGFENSGFVGKLLKKTGEAGGTFDDVHAPTEQFRAENWRDIRTIGLSR